MRIFSKHEKNLPGLDPFSGIPLDQTILFAESGSCKYFQASAMRSHVGCRVSWSVVTTGQGRKVVPGERKEGRAGGGG